MLSIRNRIKDRLYYIPYIIGFIWYYYIFITSPITLDNLRENWIMLELHSVWRCIATQFYWAQTYNLRILSNLFAMLIDSNMVVSAVVNATMLMIIAYLIADRNMENKLFWSILSVTCTIFLSKSAVSEVYFYARTLYISTVLIMLLFIEYLSADREKTVKELVLFLLLGMFWLETLIFGMAVALLTVAFLHRNTKDRKKYYFTAVVAGVLAVVDFLVVKSLARYRMSGFDVITADVTDNHSIGRLGEGLYQLIRQNVILLLLIATVWFVLTWKNKIWTKVVGLIAVFGCFVLTLINTNELLSADDIADGFYRWRASSSHFIQHLSDYLYFFTKRNVVVFIMFAAILMLSIWMLIQAKITKQETIIIACVTAYAEVMLYVVMFAQQHRVGSLSYYLIVYVLVKLLALNENKMTIRIRRSVATVCLVLSFAICANMLMFLSINSEIERNRWMIADEVRLEQIEHRWNYDTPVYMPLYKSPIDGYYTMGGAEGVGPNHRLDFLKHMRLDPRTIIVYE